jgi:pimeloyl-ACP methyl ester carboxylesterase
VPGRQARTAANTALRLVCMFATATVGLLAHGSPNRAAAEPSGGRFTRIAAAGQTDGVRLYSVERGAGDPIVLLHGFGASSYFWRKIIPALSANNRVIAIDLKGFGRSDKPVDGRYAVTEQSKLVRAFLQERGLSNVTLVGHSLGGAVALAVTIESEAAGKGLVRKLVLNAAPVYPQQVPDTIGALQRPGLGELLLELVPAETIARQTLIGASAPGTPINPVDVAAYAMPIRSPGGKEALIATARTFDPSLYQGLIARISSIRAPTLVLSCRQDVIVPLATAKRLARTIPRAELTIFDGCNHTGPEEMPRETVARIKSFLAK